MKEDQQLMVEVIRAILTIFINGLIITVMNRSQDAAKYFSYLSVLALLMTIFNTYALYDNIKYYIHHPQDVIEMGMLFFNLIELIYSIYLIFLFRQENVTGLDKCIVFTLSTLSIVINFYYFILDLNWEYQLAGVIFWIIYNLSMACFAALTLYAIFKCYRM